jgi:hypothetical protein
LGCFLVAGVDYLLAVAVSSKLVVVLLSPIAGGSWEVKKGAALTFHPVLYHGVSLVHRVMQSTAVTRPATFTHDPQFLRDGFLEYIRPSPFYSHT